MNVLCIDTSTSMGTIALAKDGKVSASSVLESQKGQADSLIDRIAGLLRESRLEPKDLDLLGTGLGPGGFTSVRVGVATLKGLALACATPIVGVSSLRIVARGFSEVYPLRLCVNRAYRGEVYAALYMDSGSELQEIVAPFHATPERALSVISPHIDAKKTIAGGSAWFRDSDTLKSLLPHGVELAAPALNAPQPAALVHEILHAYRERGAADLLTLEPFYLRPSDAELPDKPLRSQI